MHQIRVPIQLNTMDYEMSGCRLRQHHAIQDERERQQCHRGGGSSRTKGFQGSYAGNAGVGATFTVDANQIITVTNATTVAADYTGVFGNKSNVKIGGITDGTSNTLLASEGIIRNGTGAFGELGGYWGGGPTEPTASRPRPSPIPRRPRHRTAEGSDVSDRLRLAVRSFLSIASQPFAWGETCDREVSAVK